METIKAAFAEYFERWNIRLPAELDAHSAPGQISQQGWRIQYLTGEDEKGCYLDFYASHRMTSDRHVRIYESGRVQHLPAYQEHVIYAAGASEAEKRQAEREFQEYNRQVKKILEEKGFA
jgi:hypothetical protein